MHLALVCWSRLGDDFEKTFKITDFRFSIWSMGGEKGKEIETGNYPVWKRTLF